MTFDGLSLQAKFRNRIVIVSLRTRAASLSLTREDSQGDPQNPLTLDYNPAGGLSAEAAAANGQPARELPHNGSYLATLAGDYAVIDNLPPVNEPIFWQDSYEITLNGRVLFRGGGIVGPYTGEFVWLAFLHAFNQVTGLPPADLNVIIAVLEHFPSFSAGWGNSTIAITT